MTPMTVDDAAEIVAAQLGCHGAIVIPVNADGTIVVCTTPNLNHAAAVQHLAVGIHAVLSDHDHRVMKGEAGDAARDLFERLGYGAT